MDANGTALRILRPGGLLFASYSHRPDDLRAELTAAGFEVTDVATAVRRA